MIKIFPRLRYLLLILVLLPLSLERGYAQTFEDYLQPDRPEQSEGVRVTAPGRLQVEWGIGASSHAKMAGLMLRYGIIQDLEVRLEGIMRKRGGDTPRFTNLNLSSKLNLFSGEGLIPAMTLVGCDHLPASPHLQPRLLRRHARALRRHRAELHSVEALELLRRVLRQLPHLLSPRARSRYRDALHPLSEP